MSNEHDGYVDSLAKEQRSSLKDLCTAFAKTQLDEHGLAPASDPSDVHLWGVDLAHLNSDALTRAQTVVLLKFLRAREWIASDALAMLLNCLKWRKAYDVRGLMKETFPESVDSLGAVHGIDNRGNPVTWNWYGGMDQSTVDSKEGVTNFVRWRVQLMEKAIQRLDFSKAGGAECITQIHDYQGASMRPKGEMRAAIKEIIALFSDNYPEFLSTKLFINVPTLLETVFSAISVFSAARTRSKFRMIGGRSTRAALLELISGAQLPERYVGGSPLSPSELQQPMGELTVPSRSSRTIFAPVSKGQAIKFRFFTTGLDIGYSLGFSSQLPPNCNIPPTDGSYMAHFVSPATPEGSGDTKRGEMCVNQVAASEDGFAWVFLDNSYSLLTSKSVCYYVSVCEA